VARCRVCGDALSPFLSLGRMPLADRFLTPDEFEDELFYDLEVAACPGCAMVQLVTSIEPQLLFRADYPYLSSSSARMREHFAAVARRLIAEELRPTSFVVEIGCNDGVMSGVLAEAGVRHVGGCVSLYPDVSASSNCHIAIAVNGGAPAPPTG
jgi:methylation protein EvaC